MKNSFPFIILITLLLICNISFSQQGFWGTISEGGDYGGGVIFKSDSDGENMQIMHHFKKENTGVDYVGAGGSDLVKAGNGKVYGIRSRGGIAGRGTIFEYDPKTGNIITRSNFAPNDASDCRRPLNLMAHSNGKLYGLSLKYSKDDYLELFEFDPSTNTLIKKLEIPNFIHVPFLNVKLKETSNGKLYGLAFRQKDITKTLFEYDPVTNQLSEKQHLERAGLSTPVFILDEKRKIVYGLLENGMLYRFNPADSSMQKIPFTYHKEKKQYDIGDESLVYANDDKIIGISFGRESENKVMFEYNFHTKIFTSILDLDTVFDSFCPPSSFDHSYKTESWINSTLVSKNKLYLFGYKNARFIIVEYDLRTHKIIAQSSFPYQPKDSIDRDDFPAYIENDDSAILAITHFADHYDQFYFGKIIEYNITSDTLIEKVKFTNVNGISLHPTGLTQGANNKLYGLTMYGGTENKGTLYEYDPLSNIYSQKVDFEVSLEGYSPSSSLVLASNGKLYGKAEKGGAYGNGILFEYDPITNKIEKKIDFKFFTKGNLKEEEYKHIGSLTLADNGKLYGIVEGSYLVDFVLRISTGFSSTIIYEYIPGETEIKIKVQANMSRNYKQLIRQQYSPAGGFTKGFNGKLYLMCNTEWDGIALGEYTPGKKKVKRKEFKKYTQDFFYTSTFKCEDCHFLETKKKQMKIIYQVSAENNIAEYNNSIAEYNLTSKKLKQKLPLIPDTALNFINFIKCSFISASDEKTYGLTRSGDQILLREIDTSNLPNLSAPIKSSFTLSNFFWAAEGSLMEFK